jgi:hypothetical protein
MATTKGKMAAKRKPLPLRVLLDEISSFVARYVVCTEAQRVALSLWIVHTHAIDAADATPYLAVTSAEKQSGKSRLLDVLSQLVARPWVAVAPSDAVLFRKVEKDKPTLLLDETDALFAAHAPSREPLRGLLNAGNRRGATVPRCVGEGSNMEVINFPVFCAKALAGIGRLPETIADRSIEIRLKRRSKDEEVQAYRPRNVKTEAEALRRRIAKWASANVRKLKGAEPEIPDGLSDRAVEGWEPLWAIADLAGGKWPELARAAALEIASPGREQATSARLQLLADIRTVFASLDVERLTTTRLIAQLKKIDESPWRDWKGTGLNAHSLGRLLGEYEINSYAWRTKEGVRRGYRREQFADVFDRYLQAPPQ